MKISWILTILILVGGGILGWRQEVRHGRVVRDHHEVVARARGLGISLDDLGVAPPVGREKRTTAGPTAGGAGSTDLALVIDRLVEFARLAQDSPGGMAMEAELQSQAMDLMLEVLELEVADLKRLLGMLGEESRIDGEIREGLMSFMMMGMTEQQPQAALDLVVEDDRLFENEGMKEFVVQGALAQLAEEDPLAALRWIETHGEDHPDVVTDHTKEAVLRGAALRDPHEALRLAEKLGIEEGLGQTLAEGVVDDEQRHRLLDFARTSTDPELREEVLDGLGTSFSRLGFDAAEPWLRETALKPEEAARIIESIEPWHQERDLGRWMEWGAGQAREATLGRVPRLMESWTRTDYLAAGEWLAGLEQGALRDAAAVSYATTVAPYHPEAAAEWVATLPRGDSRREAAREVWRKWDGDPGAREAFGKREGVGGP